MARGFGGTVAVPAWATFMKAATVGHKAEWFEMPSGIEKVAICRLTGARAGPSCQHQYIPAEVPVGTFGTVTAGSPAPVAGLPPSQPPVYEEIFSVGALSSELCPLHSPQPSYGGISGDHAATATMPASTTPLVDAELRRAGVRLDRVTGADGISRVVIRQKQQ